MVGASDFSQTEELLLSSISENPRGKNTRLEQFHTIDEGWIKGRGALCAGVETIYELIALLSKYYHTPLSSSLFHISPFFSSSLPSDFCYLLCYL